MYLGGQWCNPRLQKGVSFVTSENHQYVGARKEYRPIESSKSQAISSELIKSMLKYFEMISSYLHALAHENLSEMMAVLQLTTQSLQHRYKVIRVVETRPVSVGLEHFEQRGNKFDSKDCASADYSLLYD